MEIRDLVSFSATARAGSFSAAARRLGYTQSAVSQHVASLEAELGVRLFDRRPVRLTPAGSRLVEHVARILLHVEVARSELAQLEARSEVHIAHTAHAAPDLMAVALRAIRASEPGTRLRATSGSAADVTAAVAAGDADIGLIGGVVATGAPLMAADADVFAAASLREDALVVAMAAGHPLASAAQVGLASVADGPWIDAPALDIGLALALRGVPHQPVTPGVTYTGGDVRTLVALVAADHGLALLPAGSAAGAVGVVAVPLAAEHLVHRTEILTLRQPRPQARRVAAALTEAAAGQPGGGGLPPTAV